MRKRLECYCFICGLLTILLGVLAGCGNTQPPAAAATIAVTSDSITESGKLLTATAANRSPNQPLGHNQSPQLTWEAVPEAACYVVCMYDEDAAWLHWFVVVEGSPSLALGAYTESKVYVGPYPPEGSGRHNYRLEVFALRKLPKSSNHWLDAHNDYGQLVSVLNQGAGSQGNIMARGAVIGTYAYGDDTR